MKFIFLGSVLVLGLVASAHAQTAAALLRTLDAAARTESSAFAGFSAQRGAAFFNQRHGSDWSCSTCHTADPRALGKHATTGKTIEPLAPARNPLRLTDPARTEKWFRRNCRDVLGRECSAAEKGDVVAYLLSLES